MSEEAKENKEELKQEATPAAAEEPKKEEAKAPAEAKEQKADAAKATAKTDAKATDSTEGGDKTAARGGPRKRGPGGGKGGQRRKRGASSRGAAEASSEYTEKVVQIRRVTKVVKGGKKLSFRAVVVIGNEKGKVGVGVGKASEVINAIKKAVTDAKKSLIDIKVVGSTIAHTIIGRAGGSKVLMRPAADGTGVIAGGTARIVLELAGVGDILAKSQGSNSPLNVARATLNGLKSIRSFNEVAAMRGMSVKQMLFA